MTKSLVALDPTDRRILRALQRDGRLPVVALAEEIGLSATPCQRRLNRLEDSGVITRYSAVLDPIHLGLPLQAFVQVTLLSHSADVVDGFQRALAMRPEVLAAYAMSGDMDFLLHIRTADFAAYSDFAMKELLLMPGVKATRSSFVMQTLRPPADLPV